MRDAAMHREVGLAEAALLRSRSDVLAVLLGGSVARQEQVETSDVDLLVVVADGSSLRTVERFVRQGLLVEWIARSESDWRQRFDRPKTSWLYAFSEGEVVFDTGPAARLAAHANEVLRTYRTPPALRAEVATTLWHAQAKLDRAIASSSEVAQGFWASMLVAPLLDALYVAHDVPLPDGARRLDCLPRLRLPAEQAELVEILLTGTPAGRLRAAARLAEQLRPRLGPPNHDVP